MKVILYDLLLLLIASVLVSWFPVLAYWYEHPCTKNDAVQFIAIISDIIGFLIWLKAMRRFIPDYKNFISELKRLWNEGNK